MKRILLFSLTALMVAFLESSDYEDAARKAVSLGGDSDTLACMTGGIAQTRASSLSGDLSPGSHSQSWTV